VQADEAEGKLVGPADGHASSTPDRLTAVGAPPEYGLEAEIEGCLLARWRVSPGGSGILSYLNADVLCVGSYTPAEHPTCRIYQALLTAAADAWRYREFESR